MAQKMTNKEEMALVLPLVQYIKKDSVQKEDDLVFPNQDWQTLESNILNAMKLKRRCLGCVCEKGEWHFEDCPECL